MKNIMFIKLINIIFLFINNHYKKFYEREKENYALQMWERE